jgi:hypothetical protein
MVRNRPLYHAPLPDSDLTHAVKVAAAALLDLVEHSVLKRVASPAVVVDRGLASGFGREVISEATDAGGGIDLRGPLEEDEINVSEAGSQTVLVSRALRDDGFVDKPPHASCTRV